VSRRFDVDGNNLDSGFVNIKAQQYRAEQEMYECLQLTDSKQGASTRSIDLPVVDCLDQHRKDALSPYVYPETRGGEAFGSFPNHWKQIFDGSPFAGITPHILRHSFAQRRE